MSITSMDSTESNAFQLGFNALPQYGFGPDLTFDSLVEANPFLFRVYAPKPLSPFFDSNEPFFIGQRFKGNYRYTADDFQSTTSASTAASATYADVADHMDWTKKSSSPYVTTSFSFAWAIWEATRRYKANSKNGVEIAVIDARALVGRAVTALELLRKGSAKERHPDHWKWYRFATEAQDVLVYGYIPGTAVLASIPILSLVPKLPSYFLNPELSFGKNFSNLTWDVTEPRPNFQQFCQQMSEQFLRSPVDVRLRDTTAGSVHLAIGFLRPWFQKHALKDFRAAVELVAELAYIIARWPGQWWVREHAEVWDLIQAMVHVIGEEVRDAQRTHALGEVVRLEGVVSELQLLTEEYVYVHSRSGSRAGSMVGSMVAESAVESAAESAAEDSDAAESIHVRSPAPPIVPDEQPLPMSSKDLAPSKVETASCVVTSFLFGVFAALFVVNAQKRELALHFT